MPNFDLKSFFESDGERGSVPVELGGWTFFLRPLDGIETEEYEDLTRQTDRAVWLLARGLLNPDGSGVSPEDARRLFARHHPLALELARRILDLTEEVWREEAARWTEAKKNSSGTRTPGSGGNTAAATGSIRGRRPFRNRN